MLRTPRPSLVASYSGAAVAVVSGLTDSPLAAGVGAVGFALASSGTLRSLTLSPCAPFRTGRDGIPNAGGTPFVRVCEGILLTVWAATALLAFASDGDTGALFPVAAWVTVLMTAAVALWMRSRMRAFAEGGPYTASVAVLSAAFVGSGLCMVAFQTLGRPLSGVSHPWVAGAAVSVAPALIAVMQLTTPRQRRREIWLGPLVLLGASGVGLFIHPDPLTVGLATSAGVLGLFLGALTARIALGLSAVLTTPSACEQALEAAHTVVARGQDVDTLTLGLARLGALSLLPESRPELWFLGAGKVLRSDVAGFAQPSTGRPPKDVIRLAEAEPSRVLQRTLLQQAQTQTGKSAAEWLAERGAAAVALITVDGDPEALLLLPWSNQTELLGPREVAKLQELSVRLSEPIRFQSSVARARGREEELRSALREQSERTDRLQHQVFILEQQHHRLGTSLAHPISAPSYSTAFREARDRLDELALRSPATWVFLPPGTSALSWAARFHTQSARAKEPFITLEGAHGPIQNSQAAFPSTGTLAVLDIGALGMESQVLLLAWLAERHSGTGAHLNAGPALIATAHASPAELAENGMLAPGILPWFEKSLVRVPSLRSRPEDLHGLILSALATVGISMQGKPLGMDSRATGALLEHDFPGNEAELHALILKAAVLSGGERIERAHLTAAGFEAEAPEAADMRAAHGPSVEAGAIQSATTGAARAPATNRQ